MYPVLSDTCYIFAQTEIDFRSLLAGKRRRTSFGGMYAAFRIRVYGMRMDLSRALYRVFARRVSDIAGNDYCARKGRGLDHRAGSTGKRDLYHEFSEKASGCGAFLPGRFAGAE